MGATGVQVSTVFPLLQPEVVVNVAGGKAVASMSSAEVRTGFIASLNRIMTEAVGTALAMFAGVEDVITG